MNGQPQEQARQLYEAKHLFVLGIKFLEMINFQQRSDYLKNKQLEQVRNYFNRALHIAQIINTEDGQRLQVDILNALGKSHNRPYSWDLDASIEICEQSLSIAREINYRYEEAIALSLIGRAYSSYGEENRNFPKAIECFEQAKSIFQETQNLEGRDFLDYLDVHDYLDILDHLQDAYGYTSNYAQAIETNYERLEIANRLISKGEQWVLTGKLLEAWALFYLGINYQSLNKYSNARKYHQQCLAKAREMNGHDAQCLQVRSIYSLGDIDRIYKKLDDAINKYQESLTIAQKICDQQGQANALQALAEIFYSQENLDRAWNYNERSLEIKQQIKDQIGEGNSIAFQGSISLARGNYDEALNYFNQSLTILKQVKNGSGIASTLTNIGLTCYYLKRIPEAEPYLSQAIELCERIRQSLGNRDEFKISIFEQQATTYQIQQLILIIQDKTTEALEVAERGRARALVELLASRLSESRTEELTIDPPTLEQIQQIAQAQNSTLVEYSIIASQLLFIWVIQPTGEVAFRSVDLKPLYQTNNTLENLVLLTRNAIGVRSRNLVYDPDCELSDDKSPSLEEFSQCLKQLHQILIQPIADLLPTEDTAKVIFMPQRFLFLVPFPALKNEFDQYLIEKHTILTAPSIQVLDLTREQQAQVNQAALTEVLVLGNPKPMPIIRTLNGKLSQLKSLPGAETEAKAIAPLLHTQAITGSNGTKEAIVKKMPTAKIIHLATHGSLDDVRGLGSAIALAPSNNDNGLLTAEEILDLKLNAELVVLSACDTGRGRLTGDGVIGLSRSFISAGVPSIIVSLWAIPDSETAGLMTEFYTNFQQNSDKAQALRQAMLITITNHPHPKNWAAFTLIGEAA